MRERRIGRTSLVAAMLLLGMAPTLVNAADLTRYRTFQLGTDLATVASQTGADASRVKVLHTRPALIQELEWRPGYPGPDKEPDTVSAAKSVPPLTPLVGGYGGSEEIVAQWQDASHRYDPIRSAYGPSFRLVGTLKRLETLAQAANIEAARLDDQEAPQREAARLADEEKAAASRLDKARLVNKPKFRP